MNVLNIFLLFICSALAQNEGAQFTCDFEGVGVGEIYEVTWRGDGTPITLMLMNGPASNLQPVRNITVDYRGQGTLEDVYVWIPRMFITAALTGYALAIIQSGKTTYSKKFSIDTEIAHAPPTMGPVLVDPNTGKLTGGFNALSVGASSAGYDPSQETLPPGANVPYQLGNDTESLSGTGYSYSNTAYSSGYATSYNMTGIWNTSTTSRTAGEISTTPSGNSSSVVLVTGASLTLSESFNTTSSTIIIPSSNSFAATTTAANVSPSPIDESSSTIFIWSWTVSKSTGISDTTIMPSATTPLTTSTQILKSSSSSDLAAATTGILRIEWTLLGGAAAIIGLF